MKPMNQFIEDNQLSLENYLRTLTQKPPKLQSQVRVCAVVCVRASCDLGLTWWHARRRASWLPKRRRKRCETSSPHLRHRRFRPRS